MTEVMHEHRHGGCHVYIDLPLGGRTRRVSMHVLRGPFISVYEWWWGERLTRPDHVEQAQPQTLEQGWALFEQRVHLWQMLDTEPAP